MLVAFRRRTFGDLIGLDEYLVQLHNSLDQQAYVEYCYAYCFDYEEDGDCWMEHVTVDDGTRVRGRCVARLLGWLDEAEHVNARPECKQRQVLLTSARKLPSICDKTAL